MGAFCSLATDPRGLPLPAVSYLEVDPNFPCSVAPEKVMLPEDWKRVAAVASASARRPLSESEGLPFSLLPDE